MIKDVYITGSPGNYKLILRTWYFQGKPDYPTLKKISDEEAYSLYKTGVYEHLWDSEIPKPRYRVKAICRKI